MNHENIIYISQQTDHFSVPILDFIGPWKGSMILRQIIFKLILVFDGWSVYSADFHWALTHVTGDN